MYFILSDNILNASGEPMYYKGAIINVDQIVEMYYKHCIDTFQCMYGACEIQVSIDTTPLGLEQITGRALDNDGFIFDMVIKF